MAQPDLAEAASSHRTAPTSGPYYRTIARHLSQRREAIGGALAHLAAPSGPLTAIAATMVDTLQADHKVLVAGNGGSAAEAQHFAAELVGRFQRDRAPYAAIALCTDSSIVTAVANDYGYEHVFSRQVLGLGRPGDLLLLYSTSGESENLMRAAAAARQQSMTVVAIVGEKRCRLERLADLTLRVPASDTAMAQELHMMITHLLCGIVETELCSRMVTL